MFAVWGLRCEHCRHLQAWAEWEPAVPDTGGPCRECGKGELFWAPEIGAVISLYGRSDDPREGWLAKSRTLIIG